MRSRLKSLVIEIIGLNDLRAEGRLIPEVPEDGNTPLENARQQVAVEDGFAVFFKRVLQINAENTISASVHCG